MNRQNSATRSGPRRFSTTWACVAALLVACSENKPEATAPLSSAPTATSVTPPGPVADGSVSDGATDAGRDATDDGSTDGAADGGEDGSVGACLAPGAVCTTDGACCTGACGGPDPFNYVFGTCS